jgi:hypothetical protein
MTFKKRGFLTNMTAIEKKCAGRFALVKKARGNFKSSEVCSQCLPH